MDFENFGLFGDFDRNVGYLGRGLTFDPKILSEKEFEEMVSNHEKNENDEFYLPYDIKDYHKALVVMDSYGCKILTRSNLENVEELCAALDCLIEDDTTKEVFKKLKNIIQ